LKERIVFILAFLKKETVAQNLFTVDKMLMLIKMKHQESNF